MTTEIPQEGALPETPGVEAASARERELQEQLLRVRAEFDNARKRLERDKLDAIRFANERLLLEVLEVADNFDRALASVAGETDASKVLKGLELTHGQLHRILDKQGVEAVSSVGQVFDPHLHEAVGVVEDGEAPDGTILEEYQKGYLLNGRLLRPSRVKVARRS
ncbi:MAG: Protein GrpE [Candidatus Omnitrophica bacterium]|nr:Protein GrpE [Candidatus Omnitrophota bacterium]